MVPEASVPVTTVPNPFSAKARSMARRGCASAGRVCDFSASCVSVRLSSSRPAPVFALTARIRRVFEKRAADEFFHFEFHDVEMVRRDEIALREDDDAALDAEQAADVKVFARLRLDGFIGGDHQQDEIDAADAGEHVAHEFFVAGNVDESDFHSGQIEEREAEVDGDTAAPFFGEAIGMRAGERFHERGFSVVDMARGADNDMAIG